MFHPVVRTGGADGAEDDEDMDAEDLRDIAPLVRKYLRPGDGDNVRKALEIIIINDGSTDNSVEIAKHYAENYPHVRLLHQANAGASVARNRGIEVATGKYVAFVDADDEVYPTMYETLMTMALEDDLDVAQCNADWCFRETGETWQSIPSDRLRSTGVLTGPDWLRMGLSSRRWTHVVWMGVYRRDVIVKNNIKFFVVRG